MAMVAFLPWAEISERLQVGRFHVVPYGVALRDRDIPAGDDAKSVAAILSRYGHTRPVDRSTVAVVRRDDRDFLAELPEEDVGDYFEFRTRLAFATLSARQFFRHRYVNSDAIRLVVQAFTHEHAGATVITSRRRDGYTRNFIPRNSVSFPQPFHVSSDVDLSRAVDVTLLNALEGARASGDKAWDRMSDALRLFVGANTDSPDVSLHSELVDMISAFSTLADSWRPAGTVAAFVAALPAPPPQPPNRLLEEREPIARPKLTHSRLIAGISRGRTMREIWLQDAYHLRSQVGHGRLSQSGYPAIWTVAEHLLLASVAFPMYVKALLKRDGYYEWTPQDEELNESLDTLMEVAPLEMDEEGRSPWQRVLERASYRRIGRALWPYMNP